MTNFLFINPFGIGDVLFTTPVLASIAKAFPGAKIFYWCNQRVAGILAHNPHISGVISGSRGDLKIIYRESLSKGLAKSMEIFRRIKQERFDAAFDFSLDHRYGLVTSVCGIKRRVGFNYKNRGRFLTHRVPLDGYRAKHAVEYYLDLLKLMDVSILQKNLVLTVPQDRVQKMRMILQEKGIRPDDLIIGIAPGAGASWGKEAYRKHWPAANFASVLQRCVQELGAKIVLFGDILEKGIADDIRAKVNCAVVDLVGATDLLDLAAGITHAKVLVTNDGGPLHMAVALGVKTVSIFGPVDEKVYGPYPSSNQHLVIKKDLPCRPCYKNFRLPLCELDRECINAVSVDEVFNAVRSLL
ncbi:MAG: glycosyltransferase family 9 protein [Candidatus Omnitrophica bacterium]|nr:glycosyltransferase family 9 protein [Candidatus Omnitrophota bacterium]